MTQHQTTLATIVCLETGKALQEATAEVAYANAYVQWYAEEARRLQGRTWPHAHGLSMTLRSPLGVVAAITPWNFPLAMITRKSAPAIAAGCTVVVKPAEETPLSALALAGLAQQAQIPPGVLNIIPTNQPAAIGELLTTHPAIAKVSFTGSTEIGKTLYQQASYGLKRLTLELGGDAPFIVEKTANIPEAVQGAMIAKFRNAGQSCIAANRFLVHQDCLEQFTQQFINAATQYVVGDPIQPTTQMGPLIHSEAVNRLHEYLETATQQGGNILLDGRCNGRNNAPSPNFLSPTILHTPAGQLPNLPIEIFGPIARISPYAELEEALSTANDTPYGLAAYLYSQDQKAIWHANKTLQFGLIGVNTGYLSHVSVPFGGQKASGFGKEGGHWGIDEYSDTKYIAWNP